MERASVTLANALGGLGFEITFITLFGRDHFFKLEASIQFYEPAGFNSKKLNLFTTLKWLRSVIKREKPDRIIVFNKFYGAIVLISLIFTKHSVFITERSSPLYNWPLKIRLINRLAYALKKPAGIIAQTSVAAYYQEKYYGPNVEIGIIPNAIRAVTLYPNIKREKIVIAVGRLNEFNKGFDQLLKAFARVPNPDWFLHLVGNDENENGSDLKVLASELGIQSRVRFLGLVKDIDPLLAKASIYVIPSRSEGFPNALCEAMAAGLACVSFDFMAGPRDIIDHNFNGLIVENGNIELLSYTIQNLIENESERTRLGENAFRDKHRFNSIDIAKRYSNFVLGGLR